MNFHVTTIQRGLFRRLAGSSQRFEYPLPNSSLAPPREAIVDRLVGAVVLRAVFPTTTDLQDMHDPT